MKKINEFTQAERQAWGFFQTVEGKKLVEKFTKEIHTKKVQLTELRSQLAEASSYATGAKWTANRNQNVVRKIDGQYNIVSTDAMGAVKAITPITNGMELSATQRNELKAIDSIDYQMFNDGHLQNTKSITRETYEVRNMLTGQPLAYTDEYTLRMPIDGEMPKVTARMQAIADQFSETGRLVANDMKHQLEMEIDKLAVEVGEQSQHKYNHSETAGESS
ncbi:MAG: hypothetical protein ACQEWW_07780 [Bacillota bacterium]